MIVPSHIVYLAALRHGRSHAADQQNSAQIDASGVAVSNSSSRVEHEQAQGLDAVLLASGANDDASVNTPLTALAKSSTQPTIVALPHLPPWQPPVKQRGKPHALPPLPRTPLTQSPPLPPVVHIDRVSASSALKQRPPAKRSSFLDVHVEQLPKKWQEDLLKAHTGEHFDDFRSAGKVKAWSGNFMQPGAKAGYDLSGFCPACSQNHPKVSKCGRHRNSAHPKMRCSTKCSTLQVQWKICWSVAASRER